MKQEIIEGRLKIENLVYAGTGGISQENRVKGFIPAFLNQETGEVALSRFANGMLAPVHLLDGLPKTWMEEAEMMGTIRSINLNVIAGFVRNGFFYTRQQAARAMLH